MFDRLWVLGAADPEMAAIESLLRECGEQVAYATVNGERVHSGNAYSELTKVPTGYGTVYAVECLGAGSAYDDPHGVVLERRRVDHHRAGDPGYGRPPSEFLAASSIGQVITELARLGVLPESWHRDYLHAGTPGEWILRGYRGAWRVACAAEGCVRGVDVPHDLVLTAAADHCLGAAYRGECPGVDPDELMRLRAESRAKFQGRSVGEILADIEAAQAALADCPRVSLAHTPGGHCGGSLCGCREGGYGYGGSTRIGTGDCYCDCSGCDAGDADIFTADIRGRHVPELPEAGTRYGISYIADGLPMPDGRRKIVCSGTADVVRAFLDHWAPSNGLVDCYGDPARGFAGGYLG